MIVKNAISSFIGVWFLFTPWIFHLTANSVQFNICLVLGAVQTIASLLAIAATWKISIMNWVSLFVGIGFIIIPNAYNMHILEIVILEILGLATILLNYALIFPESQ